MVDHHTYNQCVDVNIPLLDLSIYQDLTGSPLVRRHKRTWKDHPQQSAQMNDANRKNEHGEVRNESSTLFKKLWKINMPMVLQVFTQDKWSPPFSKLVARRILAASSNKKKSRNACYRNSVLQFPGLKEKTFRNFLSWSFGSTKTKAIPVIPPAQATTKCHFRSLSRGLRGDTELSAWFIVHHAIGSL